MCKKYLGFRLFGASIVFLLVLLMLPVLDMSEGANTGKKRILQEGDEFFYEDGTKVPDHIAEQIRDAIQKGRVSTSSKKQRHEIKKNKRTKITKDEIFNKKHYSLSDFYQLGIISFYKEAKSRGNSFVEAIKKMQNATVALRRTESKINVGRPFSVGSSTAVLLPKGYVLTAGHCVSEMKTGKFENIRVVAVDGNEFEVKVVDSSYTRSFLSGVNDWAVLKLLESYEGPTASIGTYKRGDEVIIMGYPMNFSHDENYRIQHVFSAGTCSCYAIPFIGRIIGKDKITLTVGSDILGGCSGGPIFNLRGDVIGILASTMFGTEPKIGFCPAEKVLKNCPELAEAQKENHA